MWAKEMMLWYTYCIPPDVWRFDLRNLWGQEKYSKCRGEKEIFLDSFCPEESLLDLFLRIK